MRVALPELKKDFDCQSIEVEPEKEGRVLTILEAQLYREGIDIRKVNDYFYMTLKHFIYKQLPRWKNLQGTKLVIMPLEGDRLGIKVMEVLFGSLFELYPATPISLDVEPLVAEPDLR
jgi:hypothetical protein